jgi:hypothetical protein
MAPINNNCKCAIRSEQRLAVLSELHGLTRRLWELRWIVADPEDLPRPALRVLVNATLQVIGPSDLDDNVPIPQISEVAVDETGLLLIGAIRLVEKYLVPVRERTAGQTQRTQKPIYALTYTGEIACVAPRPALLPSRCTPPHIALLAYTIPWYSARILLGS